MLHRLYKLRHRAADQKGFTLIELLVVILIIGILAAIAIPSFLGQRDKANDSAAKAEVRSAQTALETYYTDSQTYVGATLAKLKEIEPSLASGDVTIAEPTVGIKSFTVVATSKTANTFTLARDDAGLLTRSCTGAPKGGCKTGNKW